MARPQTIEELRFLLRAAQAPRIRPILEFAEQELILPEGKHEGTRYRASTLPWQKLWLSEIDRTNADGSARWRRFVLTACVQGGKTLVGWVLIILWHIFEWKENFGAGVPSGDQSFDKWRLELLPAIKKNPKFRAELPERGKGSKGGQFEAIEFKHGPTLKFLTGHGGDEKRSSITLRGSAVTEADRLDTAGEASREAAPIKQIENRSASFEDDARFYAECTSTITTGFIATELKTGSGSTPVCPCVHCRAYVRVEREHLVGWEDAASELEARENAAWICPNCSVIITEDERRVMNERGKLLHRGQVIDRNGRIHGDEPATSTFSFRVNAWDNLLWSGAYIAGEEWKAKQSGDDDAETNMRQMFWAEAIEPNAIDITPLDMADVLGAQAEKLTKGVVPAGTFAMSGAADVRKTQLHFVVIAWVRSAGGVVHGHILDVGVVPVESNTYGVKKALRLALEKMRDDRIERGYMEPGTKKLWRPGWFFIDAYWQGRSVRNFVKESKTRGIKRYIPSFGRGLSAESSRNRYQQPSEETPKKPHVGDNYYISWEDAYAMHHVIVNADEWKTFVREGFATPPSEPGALTLFDATTEDELRLLKQAAKEIVAEKAQQIVVPEKGVKTVYVNTSNRPNHIGDAVYNACCAGHLCGVRIEEPQRQVAAAAAANADRQAIEPLRMPDGREYFITNREQ
jgi:hypothetical protein